MDKKVSKVKIYILLALALLILSSITIWLSVSIFNAKNAGTEIGNKTANAVGNVIGAASAVANADDFFELGASDAVMAKDTKIEEIIQTLQVTGKLRVLEADVSLDSSHKVGKKYNVVYYMEGKVNFSVDLNNVEIRFDDTNKTLIVTIQKPIASLKIDSSTVKKLIDSKKFSFIDDAEKGSKAYINSMKEIKSNVKDSLENYDSLLKIAKEAAKIQVKDLIGSLSFAKDVVVEFSGGEQ